MAHPIINNLTDEEQNIVARVLVSSPVIMTVGAEEWDLTEEEEDVLNSIIVRIQDES